MPEDTNNRSQAVAASEAPPAANKLHKNSKHDISALNDRLDSRTDVPRYYSASERTPLLDPDDAAVSPFNLRGVRLLRLVLWTMVLINCLWALLLFLNCFVSVPFIPVRSSGFLELDLAVLSLVVLLLELLFFTTPSDVELYMGYFVTGCFVLQLILAVTIPHARHFYGIVGIFTIFWTVASLGLTLVMTPYTVKWGQDYEEERLTGRVETRRTLGEWFKVSISLILLLALVVVPALLFFFGFLLEIYDTARLFHGEGAATKGLFVPIRYEGHSKYSVYIECTPENHYVEDGGISKSVERPIVLIEADDRVSAQVFYKGWLEELYEANKVSQVCLWNRPGRGFSDVASSPFSLDASTHALTTALTAALKHNGTVSSSQEIETSHAHPFQNRTLALVSHGLGGLYSRAFAARHLNSTQSLLLIDTVHEEILRKSYGRPSRGFKFWLKGVLSPLSVRRQLSWLLHFKGPEDRYLGSSRGGSGSAGITGGRAGLAFSTNPTEIKASLQEQISAFNGDTRSQLSDSSYLLSDSKIPLAVVSSAQSIRSNKEWSALQRKLTKVTRNNVAWEILDGPHEIWADEKAKYQLQKLFLNILQETRVD